MTHSDDTIAALSTPPGESGVAVIRVTGPEAWPILSSVFSNGGRVRAANEFEHRRIYHGDLLESGGERIDEVMCAVLRAPESYTGEDTVEVTCHGNTVVVDRVLRRLFECGARAAEPGEFTKRAFLNGKLDLIQAEAVADLIHSKSDLQRRVAQEQMAGGLSTRINTLADELMELLGLIEANIDFIEDDIDTLDVDASLSTLVRHKKELGTLLESAAFARPFREGYRVTIAGPVNAGKSSLFNRMLGEKRAIVTDVPGTTRDLIREPIILEGLLFLLQDTAGLRDTDDRIEQIGVEITRATLRKSDVILFVIDGSDDVPERTVEQISDLDPEHTIIALNKTDLSPGRAEDQIRHANPGLEILAVSAETGEGFGDLEKTMIERVGRDRLNWIARERVVLNARLASILEEARIGIGKLSTNLGERAPLEILALDARDVLARYETATGKRYTDDLLDIIFSRFCIGK